MISWLAGVRLTTKKTKSIADAEAKIEDLTTKIEELTALSARLNTEIKNLESEVAKKPGSLGQGHRHPRKAAGGVQCRGKRFVRIHLGSQSSYNCFIKAPRRSFFAAATK